MRPIENVLTDLFRTTQKYGNTDQLSFFKDIAGEEAANSLQTLVQSAGSGELQKLLADLRGSQGEAQKAAKVMADNLSGDLKNLDSAWEGFRIQVEETTDGPLRSLTQGLSDLITAASTWVKENPRLTQTFILIGGAIMVLVGALGIASLTASFILGPLAKLRLALSMIGISSITATSCVSTLGVAFSGLRVILASLLGVPGLIVAAFVAASLLILRFWEPIKAFFSGLFTGISLGLSPLIQSFSFLIPLFDAIGVGVSKLWSWFSQLFTPIDFSRDALDKCASAGKTFGEVLGTALNLLFTPLRLLTEGVSLLLEKLGLIPSGIDAARAKVNDLAPKKTSFMGVGPTAKENGPEGMELVPPKKQCRQLLLAHHLRPRHCQEIPVRNDVCKASQTIQKQPLTTPRKSGRVTLFSKTCRVLWLCVAHIRKRALHRNQYREWQRPQLAALFQRQQPHRPRYQLPLPLRPAAPQFLTLPLTMLVSARIRSWKE